MATRSARSAGKWSIRTSIRWQEGIWEVETSKMRSGDSGRGGGILVTLWRWGALAQRYHDDADFRARPDLSLFGWSELDTIFLEGSNYSFVDRARFG
ncbi:hypothetical protein VCV18_006001 [Metarhizium anisopliae]